METEREGEGGGGKTKEGRRKRREGGRQGVEGERASSCPVFVGFMPFKIFLRECGVMFKSVFIYFIEKEENVDTYQLCGNGCYNNFVDDKYL